MQTHANESCQPSPAHIGPKLAKGAATDLVDAVDIGAEVDHAIGRARHALRCGGGINENLNGGTNGTTNGTQEQRKRRKALLMMHLIAISPEYSTQR
jgi:hypothetical protein